METYTLILLIAGGIVLLWIGYKLGSIVKEQEWKERLPDIRKKSVKKSREVLTGKFSEQLAPYMPDFPFSPTECRFLGAPIDIIVFKGLDNKETQEVVFVEVKSGDARLSNSERRLRDAVNAGNVSWYEYRANHE